MGSLEERRNYAFESTRAKTDQPMSSEQLYKAGVDLEYDPVQSKLVRKTSNYTKSFENGVFEVGQHMSSEGLYKAGVELEFDSSQSKLVQKTPKHQSGTSKTEEASGRLKPIKKEPLDKVEQQLRDPSSDKHFGFDKKKKCLKVEEKSHQPQRDREVKVGMNKRGTGGFF